MIIKDIIKLLDGKLTNIPHNINKKINNIKLDSRLINKDDVFICINSGINYVEDAIKKGAICIISEVELHTKTNICIIKVDSIKETLLKLSNYIRSRYHYIPLIAITGSVGKTSTKELLNYILSKKYKVLKNDSNHNNYIGISETIFKLNNDYDIILMELGMNHFKEIEDMSLSLTPDIAAITNIGTSHIGNLGSKKNILKAKMEIVSGLKGYLLVPYLDKYLNHVKYQRIMNCKDIKIHNIILDDKLNFNLVYQHKDYQISFNIPNKSYISNILLAFKIATLFNINIEEIIERINTYKAIDSRMKIINHRGFSIIDDTYNSSYESLKGVLEYISRIKGNKTIILGDIKELGKYSKEIHKKINKILPKRDTLVLLVGDDTKYIKGLHFNNNQEIIKYLKDKDLTNNIVLVKGSRLMHMEDITKYLIST